MEIQKACNAEHDLEGEYELPWDDLQLMTQEYVLYNNVMHIMVGLLMVNVLLCGDYVDVKNWIVSHHIVHWLLMKWYVTWQNYPTYSIDIY